jgi:flagellar biosynthesis GTPase FlhF
MWQAFKNWWKRDQLALEQRFSSLAAAVNQQAAESAKREQELQQRLEQAEAEAAVLREQAVADQSKRDSTEPWVEIKSAEHHPVRGLEIKLDWNEAFVQYLKDEGMTARDDETLVQKWLANMYQHVVERLEQKVIDKSDQPRVNDFL